MLVTAISSVTRAPEFITVDNAYCEPASFRISGCCSDVDLGRSKYIEQLATNQPA
jgi:hypothetical protein